MFCGRSEKEVSLLLQGLDACICADCVRMAQDYIRDFDRSSKTSSVPEKVESDYKPKDIHEYLELLKSGELNDSRYFEEKYDEYLSRYDFPKENA